MFKEGIIVQNLLFCAHVNKNNMNFSLKSRFFGECLRNPWTCNSGMAKNIPYTKDHLFA